MSKKIKVYLDTNMILDVFINHAKALKKKEDVILPKKYEFMLASKEKVEFVTSFITKAEVIRELISGYGASYEDILVVWDRFVESIDCKYIEKFEFDDKIAELAGKLQLKLRTMFNFLHLFIAMSQDAYFISGDRDVIRKAKEMKIYDKVISYEEFRKMMEGII